VNLACCVVGLKSVARLTTTACIPEESSPHLLQGCFLSCLKIYLVVVAMLSAQAAACRLPTWRMTAAMHGTAQCAAAWTRTLSALPTASGPSLMALDTSPSAWVATSGQGQVASACQDVSPAKLQLNQTPLIAPFSTTASCSAVGLVHLQKRH
jgi:hypothetical protein